MAEYRDEKETLRRRVAQLEAQLEALGADDREDARTIAELRELNAALREERDALREQLEALERSLRRTRAAATGRWDELRPRLRRALLYVAALSGAGTAVLVGLGAPDWVTFGGVALAALAGLVGLVGLGDYRGPGLDPEAARERVEEAQREAERQRRKRTRKTRARVEVQKQNVSIEATRRRATKRRKGR